MEILFEFGRIAESNPRKRKEERPNTEALPGRFIVYA